MCASELGRSSHICPGVGLSGCRLSIWPGLSGCRVVRMSDVGGSASPLFAWAGHCQRSLAVRSGLANHRPRSRFRTATTFRRRFKKNATGRRIPTAKISVDGSGISVPSASVVHGPPMLRDDGVPSSRPTSPLLVFASIRAHSRLKTVLSFACGVRRSRPLRFNGGSYTCSRPSEFELF